MQLAQLWTAAPRPGRKMEVDHYGDIDLLDSMIPSPCEEDKKYTQFIFKLRVVKRINLMLKKMLKPDKGK
jgi:hypothetical protein